MNIIQQMRRLPHAVLKKGWKITHELSESKNLDEFADVLFHRIQSLIPGESGVLGVFDPVRRIPMTQYFRFFNIPAAADSSLVKDYEAYYWTINPAIKTLNDTRYRNIAFTLTNIQTNPPYLECEFYRDFFLPQGIGHSIGLNFFVQDKCIGGISMNMEAGSRDYNEREVAILSLISPGLMGAFINAAFDSGILGRTSMAPEDPFSVQVTGLSYREMQITQLVVNGKQDMEIAQSLDISRNTVRAHLSHIFEKTGVRNRSGLISYFLLSGNQGQVSPPKISG